MMSTLIPITKEGYQQAKEELKKLKTEDKPQVISEIAEARAHGDLSENAEYHAAREKQSFLEGRIKELEDQTSRMQVIEPQEGPIEKVVFGTSITLLDMETEEEKKYTIVGDYEADIKENKISISSPLAKSLINKELGDVVSVNLPKGVKEYEITDVSY